MLVARGFGIAILARAATSRVWSIPTPSTPNWSRNGSGQTNTASRMISSLMPIMWRTVLICAGTSSLKPASSLHFSTVRPIVGPLRQKRASRYQRNSASWRSAISRRPECLISKASIASRASGTTAVSGRKRASISLASASALSAPDRLASKLFRKSHPRRSICTSSNGRRIIACPHATVRCRKKCVRPIRRNTVNCVSKLILRPSESPDIRRRRKLRSKPGQTSGPKGMPINGLKAGPSAISSPITIC